jgi:hypothetical protein
MRSARAFPSRAVLAWLGSLAAAAPIVVIVATNAIDTLFMDDWDLVGRTLVEARSGRLGIQQLFSQHNESRPFVPRLLFLAIGTAARGDTRWLLAANLALGALISYLLFRLIGATVTRQPLHLFGLALLANLLVFTPKQAETWFWPSYVGLEPIACLCAALVVLESGFSPAARVATAAVLCLAATYCYANGLFTWLLAAPVVAITTGVRWLAPWALGLLLNAAAYFRGYVQPSDPMSGLDPVRLAHYLLSFLGAPLGLGRVAVATTVGAVLLVAFALVCAYWLNHVREDGLRRRLAPWLSLGGYAVLSGIAAAVGRSSYDVPHSLSNRYVPFSLYLAVALVGAIPIIESHRREHAAPGAAVPGTRRLLLASGLAGFFGLHAASAAVGVGEMIRESRMLRYGKTCLLFILVHPDDRCLGDWVYPRKEVVVETARALELLGYLRPRLVTSPDLQDLEKPRTMVSPGVFESVSARRARLVAEGWAGRPAREGPADAVVLAERQTNGDWTPIGFAPVLVPRPDIATERGRAYRDSGWRADLLRRDFRDRSVEIGAWAFDVETASAARLENSFTAQGGTSSAR